ncbi:MAG: P63C domain-containing protein [Dehalococcoidia bacterium]
MEKSIRSATHTGELHLGGISCAVLEDGTRVLSERSVTAALGGKRGGSHWRRKRADEDGRNLPVYISAQNLRPFISDELSEGLTHPVTYLPRNGGRAVTGIRAELLPKMLGVLLAARDAGALHPSQEHIARQADMLTRGLAEIGIIALVDEATGFQEDRARDALARILEAFITDELRKWIKTFPNEFYRELFRLKRWTYVEGSKRPGVVGHLTNDLVYARLAPGILDELRERNPPDRKGQRAQKHHQWLSAEVGHPKLREHLTAVVALMKASNTWEQFYGSMERALPRHNKTLPMPFDFEAA